MVTHSASLSPNVIQLLFRFNTESRPGHSLQPSSIGWDIFLQQDVSTLHVAHHCQVHRGLKKEAART